MLRSSRVFLSGGLALSIAILQGCSGFEDAKRVMATRGPEQVYPDDPLVRDSTFEREMARQDLLGLFVTRYLDALPSGKKPDDPKKDRDMAVAGYDLVDHYCEQYFAAGGENQKWLNLAKDLVAALGTLATGISALTAAHDSSTTAGIALGTATAYNGIDVYTRNFLFGAENIDSVRTLTMNALEAQRKATIPVEPTPGQATVPSEPAPGQKKTPAAPSPDQGKTPAKPAPGQAAAPPEKPSPISTFGRAVLLIEDHQALCQSAKIRAMVLEAVKTSTVTAYTPSGTAFTAGGTQPAAPTGAQPNKGAGAQPTAAAPTTAAPAATGVRIQAR